MYVVILALTTHHDVVFGGGTCGLALESIGEVVAITATARVHKNLQINKRQLMIQLNTKPKKIFRSLMSAEEKRRIFKKNLASELINLTFFH